MTKSILDPSFRYTKSGDTDIRKTFRRIRRQIDEASKPRQEPTVLTMRPAYNPGVKR